jgi:6-phosphogluconolactonase
MLLGLGEDAHIASIFPGSELLQSRQVKARPAESPLGNDERVAAVWAQHLRASRLTLTPDALLDARAIVLLVAGAQKADAVHAAIEAPLNISRWPAQILREAGDRVEWLIDRAAAARLHIG